MQPITRKIIIASIVCGICTGILCSLLWLAISGVNWFGFFEIDLFFLINACLGGIIALPLLGALKEEDMLQPVNVYGQHKLECEQRAQWNLPEAVGLRLTWMYDLTSSSMKLNRNILVNLQKAHAEGNPLKAATHEYRGVTNVWETEWILPDEERFCEEPRNLTMDCSIIEEHGIHFKDSVEGIEEAIKRPFRY